MAHLRVTSLIVLTASVFMKRIRGMVYKTIYGDKRYQSSRVANLIHHLASGSQWPESFPAEVSRPSRALRRIADTASTMPTTLWFDHPDELRDLVACGQATICFNLMKWITRNHGGDPATYPPEMKALWERTRADWEKFVADPFALLDLRLAGRDR